MAKGLLLIGGGGHCCSVIDSLVSDLACPYDKIAVIDTADKRGCTIAADIVCIGTDDELEPLRQEGYTDAFISLGSIGNPALRIRLAEKAAGFGYQFPNIIDPTAVIGQNVSFGSGIYVGKRAVINYGCLIGDGAIINTGSILEHQCRIGKYCHIAPGAVLCGNVKVGSHSHVGAGSAVKQGISIGNDTVIGLGSTVVKDIGFGVIAFGNPCEIRQNIPTEKGVSR